MTSLLSAVAAADALIDIAALYAGVGFVVAVAFSLFGVTRALTVEGRVTIGARLFLLPASTALWPLVASRWLAASRAP
ncbi:MAG TPA: hypothetical protein VL993_08870 [Stellaceae bacterium]|nr:hypothetical protein [Stellaceae bacterium]